MSDLGEPGQGPQGDRLLARSLGVLRTALATPVVGAETAALGTAVILASPFTRKLQEPVQQLWARGLLSACGVRLSVEGREKVDPAQRYVVVSNHQSHLDVPSLMRALPIPVRFVAKRELFKVPIFGQAMRALGEVDVDRRNPADSHRKLIEAQEGIARVYSLLFFAEGHRSPDGRLLPFKRGAVAMALQLGLPLLPVAVTGTNRILRPGWNALRPGPARVEIGDPIQPGENTPAERDRLLTVVRDHVEAMIARGL